MFIERAKGYCRGCDATQVKTVPRRCRERLTPYRVNRPTASEHTSRCTSQHTSRRLKQTRQITIFAYLRYPGCTDSKVEHELFLCFVDDAKLSIRFDFTDHDWFVQMMIRCIHHEFKARWRFKGLTTHRGNHFVGICRLRFFYRLLPHIDTNIRRFHRIIRYDRSCIRQFLCSSVGFPFFDEFGIDWIFNGLKVIPCGKVTYQWLGIDTT